MLHGNYIRSAMLAQVSMRDTVASFEANVGCGLPQVPAQIATPIHPRPALF
jgi:hypothetical protein